MADPRIAMVAGETSGDLLAGLLLDGLHARWPQLQSAGIGGPRMAERGFDAWWPSDKLAVRGYVEVLRHYRGIVAIRKALRSRLLAAPPDVFVGVDAPDFNLDLEADLRAAGISCVHFVAPSVWAWRPERVAKIRRSADHVLCIFPFEPELLARDGIAATYVGHPLASVIPQEPDRAAARAALGLDPQAPVLAVLPGSRASEVQYLASRFFRAAALVQQALPAIECIVPAVPALRPAIERAAAEAGMAGRLRVVEGRSHAVLAACDVTLIASGTATLEAALFKRPMVIGYNMHWLSWRIMAPKRLQPWVGLPNILCRDFVVPELLQEACTPRALADAVLRWFDRPDEVETLQARFSALHDELRRDTPALAAHAIQTIFER
ncbi:lipid-A-disaccharide synthase [uncultured Xylophilus sp.]|uniref:lipid-A-disaccharide synthase n=1 Tax=uncultured Xylophilus sp. TaxID=296832 RepID=UPI0025E8D17D|nr:lipid-A-disaccharide synthase [uncultured Xylophilus sp.]